MTEETAAEHSLTDEPKMSKSSMLMTSLMPDRRREATATLRSFVKTQGDEHKPKGRQEYSKVLRPNESVNIFYDL